jgi:Cu+-exporting ATPase
MKTATVAKDPVCGMDVDIATAAGHSEHKGNTHHFCGIGCKKKFDLNPEQYLGKDAKTAQGGKGCCC